MDKTISYYVKDFKANKNIGSLMMSIYLIFKEGRFVELLYGVYGYMFYKSSELKEDFSKKEFFTKHVQHHLKQKYNGFKGLIYRDYLEEKYGQEHDFSRLPKDVRFRLPSILKGVDWLILGEYGNASGRIFFFRNGNMQTIDMYNHISGFRHIHCIHLKNENELFINTGDDKKFLDIWTIAKDEIVFKKRIMKQFAGFTAAVEINKEHYFGSDFSQRPNYILRLSDGKKFFFPEPAYTMFVMYFEIIDNRYILSCNMHTVDYGGKTITIFDTELEEFVFISEI